MNDESSAAAFQLTRRNAVRTAAGVAAAGTVLAVGARTPAEAATAPAVPAAADAGSAAPAPAPAAGAEPLIVHVRNVQTGELAFYVGEREITVHDQALAARLAAAAR